MTVDDYKKCAQKHLTNCKIILKFIHQNNALDGAEKLSNIELNNLLIEVYYLLGYVIEGFAVYIAYKRPYKTEYENNNKVELRWNPADDIKKHFNYDFSYETHIAFNPNYSDILRGKIKRAFLNGYKKVSNGNDEDAIEYFINTEFADQSQLYKKLSKDPSVCSSIGAEYTQLCGTLKNVEIKYLIKNHSFNRKKDINGRGSDGLVMGYIYNDLATNAGVNGTLGVLPYFGGQSAADIDQDVLFLIEKWSTELRYNYVHDGSIDPNLMTRITQENLKKFIDVCDTIMTQLINYV